MNVMSFLVNYQLITFDKNTAIIPFNIVCQTKSLVIENYLAEKWPLLLTHSHIFSMEDNLEKYKMYKYIKNNLNTADIVEINKVVYDRYVMSPLQRHSNLIKIQMKEFNAKIWTNPTVPYLELAGEIKLDLKEMVDYYINTGWLAFSSQSSWNNKPMLKFRQKFPYVFTASGVSKQYDIILSIIKEKLNSDSKLTKQIQSFLGLKNFSNIKKEISWSVDKQSIIITIKDLFKIIKSKLNSKTKFSLLNW